MSPTPYQKITMNATKVAPVNLKIETPDKPGRYVRRRH